jgi:hypothetical protein
LGLRGRRLQGSGEDCTVLNCVIYTPYKCYLGDKIMKDEMGGACGMDGEEETLI